LQIDLEGEPFMTLIAIITVLAATFFCGAAFYVTLVEHPARIQQGTAFALQEFVAALPRVRALQRGLAICSILGSLVLGLQTHDRLWFAGTGAMFLILPFTWLALTPINSRLLKWPPEGDLSVAEGLLVLWGRRHMVRDVLSLLGSIIFVYILMRSGVR
jgi:hypothetical protein